MQSVVRAGEPTRKIDQGQRSTFGNPLDALNGGERAASFPFVGKHEPCRIRAESIEGLFVREIQQVRLAPTVERTNAQLQTPAMFRQQREHAGLIALEDIQVCLGEVDCHQPQQASLRQNSSIKNCMRRCSMVKLVAKSMSKNHPESKFGMSGCRPLPSVRFAPLDAEQAQP